MKKPILRWTIGNTHKENSYEILSYSIKNIHKIYENQFDYFVCYNDVNLEKLEKIKNKYKKINFLKQSWSDCPLDLEEPNEIKKVLNQKLNGSFWKICPPRIDKTTHEIILDNDLIFLKKSKTIDKFLKSNKNLIIRDSNLYLGKYEKLFPNEKQGYNSGVIGLAPKYDFEKDIIKNYSLVKQEEKLDFAEEQGLLTYTLFSTNPIIGDAEEFAGIHCDLVYLNCLPGRKEQKNKDKNKNKFIFIDKNTKLLEEIFEYASVVHFLGANRYEKHIGWEHFKNKKMKIY